MSSETSLGDSETAIRIMDFEQEKDLAKWLASIDEQHFHIERILQKLEKSRQVSVRSEVISEVLNDLTRLASEHFQNEEGLLEALDYPGLPKHKAEHVSYRIKVASLCLKATNHDGDVPNDLLDFLHEWWRGHIDGEDRKAEDFLQSLKLR